MEPIIPSITGTDALAMLAEAVREKGSEYTYENPNEGLPGPQGCVYVHGTELVSEGRDSYGDTIYNEVATGEMRPGCMIGTALIGRGIPMSMFVELKVNADTPIDELIQVFREYGMIGDTTPDAIDALRSAQTAQDQGDSWGEAYITAREAVGMYRED